jgi:hypothetical protein
MKIVFVYLCIYLSIISFTYSQERIIKKQSIFGLTQQQLNDKNFYSFYYGDQISPAKHKDGGAYANYIMNIGLSQILFEGTLSVGIEYKPLEQIGVHVFGLIGGSGLLTSITYGIGAGATFQLNDKLAVETNYFYKGAAKIWDIKSDQWYIKSNGIKVGLNFIIDDNK